MQMLNKELEVPILLRLLENLRELQQKHQLASNYILYNQK